MFRVPQFIKILTLVVFCNHYIFIALFCISKQGVLFQKHMDRDEFRDRRTTPSFTRNARSRYINQDENITRNAPMPLRRTRRFVTYDAAARNGSSARRRLGKNNLLNRHESKMIN